MVRQIVSFFIAVFLALGCSGKAPSAEKSAPPSHAVSDNAQQGNFIEDFERGEKKGYAQAFVRLKSGQWMLDNALIGQDDNDRKSGSQAVRVKGNGKLTMLFDVPNGAGVVSVKHGVYGRDEGGKWELWRSVDGGSTWARCGASIQSTSPTLQTATFTLNVQGNVRLEIRCYQDEKSRLNFDDVSIAAFGQPASPTSSVPSPSASASSSEPTRIADHHLTLGIPTDADNSDDYILKRPQYVLSYNRYRNTANWVSWNLNAAWFGTTGRTQTRFSPDPDLPALFYRVTHDDYTGSGFDRGHIVRSEERTRTIEDNAATFYTTNILPQRPDLNQGVWNDFEKYCEELCKRHNKELFVIAGGIFEKNYRVIGKGVAVPKSTWKIVVVLERGQGVKDITANTRVIAVDMPNIDGIRYDKWQKYKTTVRTLENATGYNFLSALPKALQDALETKLDAE